MGTQIQDLMTERQQHCWGGKIQVYLENAWYNNSEDKQYDKLELRSIAVEYLNCTLSSTLAVVLLFVKEYYEMQIHLFNHLGG